MEINMPAHKDTFRSKPSDPLYRSRHTDIFGPKKPTKALTPAEEKKLAKAKLEVHKQQVRDGKKDAQYYLDNEVRVSANPNFTPSRVHADDEVYKANFAQIDWSKK
jgi:hypothetical protein